MNEIIRNKEGFIIDMDGVLYHGNRLLEGALEFVDWLKANNKKYLFLTNSSERSPRELSQKLARLGIAVEEEHFYTSAIATAIFLASQTPRCSAYIIGEPGLINALYDVGITMNDVSPEYVIIGETRTYNFEKIEKAVQLIQRGAKFIGTNPDVTGPTEKGMMPATGALAVPIEIATGKHAYYVGKPNPLMMRHALKKLGIDYKATIIVGDRMDTDIVAGMESEIDTILVLSGVTNQDNIQNFSFRPTYIYDTVGDIIK